jgi:hypothetical protein
MLTLRTCTGADAPAVAALWNVKTLDAQSCWYQAATIDANYVGGLLNSRYTLVLALEGETPLGFGLWCGPPELLRLVAVAADTDAVYFRLMAEFAARGLAAGAVSGFAEIDARLTTERARMDSLGVITYRPIGFEPLSGGAESGPRVPKLFWAECSLAVLSERLAEIFEAPA